MRTLVCTLWVLLLPLYGLAQLNDCENAEVVCDNADLEFNPMGPGNNDFADPDNFQGCITALEQNSAWYYFQIDTGAPPDLVLGFIIHPNGGFGEDYDWALFGPDATCGNLGFPIRCSSSSAACDFCPETGMGMGAMDVTEGPGTGDGFVMTLVVQPGQGFYLLIDNWLGTTNGFVMEWTDSAADYLNCAAKPPCALEAQAGPDVSACEGDEEIQLNGGSTGNHGGESYVWTGTNGGTGFLDDAATEDPTVTFPPGFTGVITYTLTVVEDTCMSEDEMELVVHQLPTVQINPAGPFCPNLPPQTLTATPPGGIWGGDATGTTFNPMTNGPGIHTVTYTYTDANGCSAMATMDILVHDAPEVSADPDPAAFCENEISILLSASADGGAGNYVYNWSTPSGLADGPEYNATLSGLHFVTVTDANGCTDSTAVSVVVYLNPVIVINDPGPICGSIPFMTLTASPSGGVFDGAIISPQGDLIPNTLDPGVYTISYSFTDNNNCASTEYLDIEILSVPEAIAGNNGPICAGQQIVLTGDLIGSGTFIQYFWTGPNGYTSNAQSPTDATAPGEYFLQVVVDGCPSSMTLTTVVVHDLPEAIATNGGPYCNGETIVLMGSTNQSGNIITYAWTGPNGFTSDVQNPLNAVAPGIYTLIVTLDGCPSLPTTTEVLFSPSPDATATNSGPYCAGDSIALFGSTLTSGTVITYQWSGPNGYLSSVQNPIDAAAAGLYQLVVSVDGCQSVIDSTTVTVHPAPQPVITGQQAFCTGFSSTMDAGAFASYIWDDGSMNRTRQVFAAGTYAVTVTDVNGCTGTATFDVIENTALSPVITGALEFCAGSGTTLDAGSGFATYVWSTGDTSQTIVVTAGGNIGVVVTDADGCTGSAAINAVMHSNPIVTIGGSTTYCIGGYTVLDAGTFTSYQWNNDSVSQTITVSAPGVYTVSVVDNNGCAGSDSVDVQESTSLNPVITGGLAFCENGSTTLNAGSGFATYLWSDGSMNQTLVVNVAGSYAVSVSDNQGCTGEATVTVVEVLPPAATVQTTATLCNTVAGGSVINLFSLILSGDMNGTWQDVDNSGATGLFNNLNFASVPAGDYRFIYTTNSATAPCPESTYPVTVTIIDCTCPDVFFFNAGALCNDGDVLDVTSIENTSESGAWSVIQTPGGPNPATLNGNLFDPTGSDVGGYILQFTLQNQPPPGCPVDFEVSVQVDAAVDAGTPGPPVALCADDDQMISLAGLIIAADPNGIWTETSLFPSQGNAFNPTNGTFSTTNQAPGTYTFNYALSGSGACPDDNSEVSVIIHPAPTAMVVDNVVIDCANLVQTLDGTGSSFGPEYVITWTGPGIVADGNENTLYPTINQAGNYILTIEHLLSGCRNTAAVNVTANTDPPTGALINSRGPACFGEQTGFIHVNQVAGGTAPYTYMLNSSASASIANFNLLAAGTYDLIVIDANGCRWDTTLALVEPPPIHLDIGPDIELGLGESGEVHAMVDFPINEIDALVWAPPGVIECLGMPCLDVLVHAPNSMTLQATVYDTNGCQSTDQLFVDVNKERHIHIPNVFSPNGDNVNDVFYVMGDPGQIVEVRQFLIFDRWGALVHKAVNFAPNDPSSGWDGHGRNAGVNPGVFAYVAEVEYIDNVVLVYTGDVTVVK